MAEEIDTSKLDQKLVAQIVEFEKEADSMMGEADSLRSNAAQGIVKLLDAGASERQVAAAIGKSDTHVHWAAVAWRTLQEQTDIKDFQTAYKLAKRPAAQREANPTGEPQEPTTEIKPDKIDSWAKQVRDLQALLAAMTERANENQIKQLVKELEKGFRAAVSKQEEMESST